MSTARVRSWLQSVFEQTEEANRREILAVCLRRPGATVLDVGCGNGSMTVRVASQVGAGRVLGVELVEPLAASARRRGVEVTRCDIGAGLPHADASIDVVHSNQVIEHVAATDLFMAEVRRVLKPDGYAVVSTNNLSSLHNIASLVLGYQPPPCHVSDEVVGVGSLPSFATGMPGAEGQLHLRLFTARALAALAAHHGLQVQLARSAGFYPFGPRAAAVVTRVASRYGAFLVQRYSQDPTWRPPGAA